LSGQLFRTFVEKIIWRSPDWKRCRTQYKITHVVLQKVDHEPIHVLDKVGQNKVTFEKRASGYPQMCSVVFACAPQLPFLWRRWFHLN